MNSHYGSAGGTLFGRFLLLGRWLLSSVFAVVVVICLGLSFTVAVGDEEYSKGIDGVVPLSRLLVEVHESYPGHVLDVELEREEYGTDELWTYEVKLLTARGSVLKLEYDAATLKLLRTKGGLDH